MKTTRRSHFATLGSFFAAFFGLSWNPAAASSVRRASDGLDQSTPANYGPKVVVSPDGRTRTYFNTRGEVVRIERFDQIGRLVETVTMEWRTGERRIDYRDV